jgi:hypothetical protein
MNTAVPAAPRSPRMLVLSRRHAEATVHGGPVFVACPARLELGRSLEPRPSLLSTELGAPAIAPGIAARLGHPGPDVELLRPANRHGANRPSPTVEESRPAYQAIFQGLLSDTLTVPASPVGPSARQRSVPMSGTR